MTKEQIEKEMQEYAERRHAAMMDKDRDAAYVNWHRADAVLVYLQEKLKRVEQEAEQ